MFSSIGWSMSSSWNFISDKEDEDGGKGDEEGEECEEEEEGASRI